MTYSPDCQPEKLGLESCGLDEPDMSYEFNMIRFWKGPDGRIFGGSDSGCSCPSPFEQLESADYEDFAQKAERVGSIQQAEDMIKSWNKGYDGRPYVHSEDINKVLDILKSWGLA